MAAAALVNILRNVVPTPLYYSSTTAMKVKSMPLNSTHVSVQHHSVCRGVHDVVHSVRGCQETSGRVRLKLADWQKATWLLHGCDSIEKLPTVNSLHIELH